VRIYPQRYTSAQLVAQQRCHHAQTQLRCLGNRPTMHLNQPTLAERYDGRSRAYHRWRSARLRQCEAHATAAPHWHKVNPGQPQTTAHDSLVSLCASVKQEGYALYQCLPSPDDVRTRLTQLHHCLGLRKNDTGVVTGEDDLSLLEDLSGTARGRFIPYTSRAMNWHTDGYYNDPMQCVRCFSLHCVQPAEHGGTLTLMDNELLLIALYDEEPQLVVELAQADAMLLPANTDEQGHSRPDRQVPVISMHEDATLATRFTTRVQYITWRSADTQRAAERAVELVNANPQWHATVRLTTDQGVITRNILHRRESFEDSDGSSHRQMLRGRFLQLPTPPESAPRNSHVACQ